MSRSHTDCTCARGGNPDTCECRITDAVLDRARFAELIIERAERAGVSIDSGNVIDLLADHMPEASLEGCRHALRVSSFRNRWPAAEHKQSMGIKDDHARVTVAPSLNAAPTAGGVTAPGVSLSMGAP